MRTWYVLCFILYTQLLTNCPSVGMIIIYLHKWQLYSVHVLYKTALRVWRLRVISLTLFLMQRLQNRILFIRCYLWLSGDSQLFYRTDLTWALIRYTRTSYVIINRLSVWVFLVLAPLMQFHQRRNSVDPDYSSVLFLLLTKKAGGVCNLCVHADVSWNEFNKGSVISVGSAVSFDRRSSSAVSPKQQFYKPSSWSAL